jgi:predicted nucleotide-binding protein (sugar kinase/HSP70/actin superfamily)
MLKELVEKVVDIEHKIVTFLDYNAVAMKIKENPKSSFKRKCFLKINAEILKDEYFSEMVKETLKRAREKDNK